MTTVRIISINIYRKDAIGNFCYDLAAVYQKNGFTVELYSNGFDLNAPVKPYEHLFSDVQKDDIIFYHFSIYDSHAERVANIDAKKIVYFHGITPPELLKTYFPETAKQCEDGLEQLSLLNQFDVLCVNSNSTFDQLKKHTNPKQTPCIIPPIVSSRDLLNTLTRKNNTDSQKTVLCVGRVVPHKKIEDVIEIFKAFEMAHPEINAQLKIVGTTPPTEYQPFLVNLIEKYELKEKVLFKGFVDDSDLAEEYATADVYIMASEHEGFGVPLLEALKCNIPILAYAKNGIGEVLGDAGCQFHQKEFNVIAKQLHVLLTNQQFVETILSKQKKQFEKIMHACDESVFTKLLNMV